MAQPTLPSSGVQELVQKLREEGVAAGRREAEQMVAAAREEAARIVAGARREADETTRVSHAMVETERQAAHAALDLAARDAMLQLREQFEVAFVRRLQSLVAAALQEPGVLVELVVQALRQVLGDGPSGERAQLLVPEDWRQDPQAAIIHLADRGIELAVTDETLAVLLLERLLPRFRALFESRLVQEQDRG